MTDFLKGRDRQSSLNSFVESMVDTMSKTLIASVSIVSKLQKTKDLIM